MFLLHHFYLHINFTTFMIKRLICLTPKLKLSVSIIYSFYFRSFLSCIVSFSVMTFIDVIKLIRLFKLGWIPIDHTLTNSILTKIFHCYLLGITTCDAFLLSTLKITFPKSLKTLM